MTRKYDVTTKTWVRKVDFSPSSQEPSLFETYEDFD